MANTKNEYIILSQLRMALQRLINRISGIASRVSALEESAGENQVRILISKNGTTEYPGFGTVDVYKYKIFDGDTEVTERQGAVLVSAVLDPDKDVTLYEFDSVDSDLPEVVRQLYYNSVSYSDGLILFTTQEMNVNSPVQSAYGVYFSIDETDIFYVIGAALPLARYQNATTSADGLMSSTDKAKLDGIDTSINYAESATAGGPARKAVAIPSGTVDSTSTATAFTATIDGITELVDGVCVMLKNGTVTSASGCTLNINGLGAKPIYNTMAANSRVTTTWNVAYTMLFVYNTTRVSGGCWDMYYGYNTTYSALSQADMQAGTSTTSRLINAERLKEAVEYHAPTYALSIANGVITLTCSNGDTSSVTLPTYAGTVYEDGDEVTY